MAPSAETGKGGVLGSAKRLLATLVEIVETRIALAVNEIEEQRARSMQLAVTALVTLFLSGMAMFFVTLFVIVAFWETNRIAVVGGFALLYLALAVIAAMVLRHRARNRPRLFATTLAELRKDREQLGPHP